MRTLAQHNDYVEDILRWEQAITQVTNSKGKLHCEQLLATLKDKIKNILECSAFAPSGHNIQPWHVYVVEGKKKEAITKSILLN